MTWIPCVLMAAFVLLVAYFVTAIVLCCTTRCFQRGDQLRKSALSMAGNAIAVAFMPRHFRRILIFVILRFFLFVLVVGFAFGLVDGLMGRSLGLTGDALAFVIALLIWYVTHGRRETRKLVGLLRKLQEDAQFQGLCCPCRFRTQLLAVVIGCIVAWALYTAVFVPVRLHFAGALIERRFDERLAMTEYSTKGILGHRGRSLSRSVMRKTICDDWRLQLFCGDIPVDWLLGEIDDLEKRILENGDRARHCPAQRNVRWGVEIGSVVVE